MSLLLQDSMLFHQHSRVFQRFYPSTQQRQNVDAQLRPHLYSGRRAESTNSTEEEEEEGGGEKNASVSSVLHNILPAGQETGQLLRKQWR